MVKGLAKFREHFRGYEREFVLIGGAACDEWFDSRSLRFRSTKDLDIVFIVEAITPTFLRHFWAFIRAGRYQTRECSTGNREYFRFVKPQDHDYPVKMEIFSRRPDGIELFHDQEIVPIPAGEDLSSLSAILIDPDYYNLILASREICDGLPLVRPDGLIVLKARAWTDLTRRKQRGDEVDADDIRKHRNDVFRLALTLPAGGHLELPETIRDDLRSFLLHFSAGSPGWTDIRASLRGTLRSPPDPERMIDILTAYFAL